MTTPMTRNQRRIGVTICFFTIVLAILDQNIVSAAIVPIATDLDPVHGLDRMPWVVTAFSLAATAALPLYGRLTDVLGPTRVFVGAVATFVAGSMLCGASQTLLQLIFFRALQGIGAGGLISVAMVVVAHLTKSDDDADADKGGGPSGMAGIIFGIGMTVGPPVGGIFADHGIWRWVFYVNVPLGVAIIAGALTALRLPRPETRGSIDFPGAALAAAFASAVLLISDWGGDTYAWTSAPILALAAAAVVSLGLFLWRQTTVEAPILPLSLFRIRAIRNSYVIQGLVGMALMGVMVFLLMYLQVARGVSATGTGTFLVFLAAGITISGFAGARLGLTLRGAMTAGTAIAAAALVLLTFMRADTSLWTIRGEMLLLGIGFGLLLGRLILVVQQAAPAHHMGVAITGVRFFQMLGGAAGAAVLGSVLRRSFADKTSGQDLTQMRTLTGAAHDSAMTAFADSLGLVFMIAAAFMVIAVFFATRLRVAAPAVPQHAEPVPAEA